MFVVRLSVSMHVLGILCFLWESFDCMHKWRRNLRLSMYVFCELSWVKTHHTLAKENFPFRKVTNSLYHRAEVTDRYKC